MLCAPHAFKAFLVAGVAAFGLNLANAEMAAARPKPEPIALAPPPPPVAPPVVLSTHALQDASAFRAYVKHTEALTAGFTDGGGVEQSLAVGAAYESAQLSRGAIAYAALLALQDPTFVATLHGYALDPAGRHALVQQLVQDPRYVIAFHGADSAAGIIVATMGGDTGRMFDVAAQIKQSAYSVQHSAWSKTKVTNPSDRLAQMKTLSESLMSPAPDDVEQLKLAMNGGADAQAAQVLAVKGVAIQGPYAPVVERGLALAAVAVLGEAGDDNDATVQALTSEPTGGACLHMAKLNLYQCLAVAVPWYEDIFCLGEHALHETAQCISKDAATPDQIQLAQGLPVTPVVVAVAAPPPVAKTIAAKSTKARRRRHKTE
ncbi:hypothetical protein [Caulobacter sp. S45]|uniref:hypothetical protein n=1 Tax=Caulobacter sp. S45 TaxID=1641861 RepID=UPI00131AD29F|nr:hypothetical protein [Caulobacter sp. S45]